MFAETNCPQCGRMLERGVLRTHSLIVHPEQMLAALREAAEAEWQGRSARVFAGTATTIVYRNQRGEKMLRCLYCPDCAVVVAARNDLIVDAPSFLRFARRASGGHTVFASRLRAWRLARGVVAGALIGIACGAVLLMRRHPAAEFAMFLVVFFAGLGLCWGMWGDVRSSLRRARALRLTQIMDDHRRAKGEPPLSGLSPFKDSPSSFPASLSELD